MKDAQEHAHAPSEKPLVYNMRPQASQGTGGRSAGRHNFPQIIDFKPVSTYTGRVTRRCLAPSVLALGSVFLSAVVLVGQAIEKSMYVTVVNAAGAPVPDLGPPDFVIREDNVSREILRVAPAT